MHTAQRWTEPDRQDPLAETRRMLSTLLSNLPGMVYRCRNDPDWTMEFVSAGCHALTEYDPEDLVCNKRVSLTQLIHPDDRQHVWDQVQNGIRDGQPYRITYRITTAGGHTRWVWEQGRPVVAADGRVLALEGYIADVTARHQAETAEAEMRSRYRTLAELTSDGVFETDAFGVIAMVNPRWCELTGMDEAEAIGSQVTAILADAGLEQSWLSYITSGDRFEAQVAAGPGCPAGPELLLMAMPVQDDAGKCVGHLGTLQPVCSAVGAPRLV